jgi:F-type H+-transporting ATPase subunit c
MVYIQLVATALAIGLGAVGAGIAMGGATGRAYEALGRNPEAAGTISQNLLLGLVFAETLAIYGLVIAFLILFH